MTSAPVPRQDCILRILCILCGLCMIGNGVILFILYNSSLLFETVLKVYYIIFGIIMILIELEPKFMKKYWRFLIQVFGKGLFYIFAGTMCIYGDFVLTYLLASINIIIGVFILCCKPRYGQPQASDPPEENRKVNKK
ncbi:hypothetical protein SteCoe_13530 [Stentor coeruleus]|uniref:COPI associated protein n=1 Tax=Stentor coeruleus TaxID=5963 RepID=A0A1R2C867_9CILI|nr:hypothetical protein SteCoe_13530 [Stentor coeruleus]